MAMQGPQTGRILSLVLYVMNALKQELQRERERERERESICLSWNVSVE
jgi:hypothetical protein